MDTSKNLFPHDHYVNAERRKELINQKPLLIWLSRIYPKIKFLQVIMMKNGMPLNFWTIMANFCLQKKFL